MQQFTLLITDDRYAAPCLATLVAQNEARAVQLAWGMLMKSEHHKLIDVLDHGRSVDRVQRPEAQDAFQTAPGPTKVAPERRGWWFRGSTPPTWYRKSDP